MELTNSTIDTTKDTIVGLQGRRFVFPEVKSKEQLETIIPHPTQSHSSPDKTVESLAALIPKPLTVVRRDGKIIHDNITLVVKCPKGHIHRAYLNTLDKEQTFACLTCSLKSPYMIVLRDTLGDMYNLPFTVNEAGDSFSVPIYKLIIRLGTDNTIVDKPKGVIIDLKRSKSAPKIHQQLDKFLTPLIERFPLLRHNKPIWRASLPPITKEMSQLRTDAPGTIVSSESLCIEDCIRGGYTMSKK